MAIKGSELWCDGVEGVRDHSESLIPHQASLSPTSTSHPLSRGPAITPHQTSHLLNLPLLRPVLMTALQQERFMYSAVLPAPGKPQPQVITGHIQRLMRGGAMQCYCGAQCAGPGYTYTAHAYLWPLFGHCRQCSGVPDVYSYMLMCQKIPSLATHPPPASAMFDLPVVWALLHDVCCVTAVHHVFLCAHPSFVCLTPNPVALAGGNHLPPLCFICT